MEKDLSALRIDRDKRNRKGSRRVSWRFVIVAFLMGAFVAAGLFRAFFWTGHSPAQAESVDIREATGRVAVSASDTQKSSGLEPVLIVSGYIVPHHRIEVGSKILGKISWVGVEKSDKVEKGQLLVKLDDRDFSAQYEQAQATLAASEARLAELQAGSRTEEIERAEAELQRAKADLANSELEYQRLESLLGSGVVSKQIVDNARARRDMANAAVGVAEKNYRLAVLGPRKEAVALARAEVERNKAALRYWETQLSETEIRAPITGTVLERIAEVGEMVSTSFAGGAVVVALADLNDLQVELDISQSDFGKISQAEQCRMSPVAFPDRRYDCQLAEIAPEANRQRATIQVKVQVLNPDEYLRPEMDAQVTFFRGPEEKTLD